MKIDPEEASRVWWHGAIKGSLLGLLGGAVVGLGSALLLAAALPGMAVPLLPFIAAGAVVTGITGLINGGSTAVNAHHQQMHNTRDETNINVLTQRVQALEQAPAASRAVRIIIARGPQSGFAQAQVERNAQAASTTPTLH